MNDSTCEQRFDDPVAGAALADALAQAGRALDGADAVVITGEEPILPTNFRVAAAGAAAIAASGLGAVDLWRLRTDRGQQVAVDMRAAAAALRSQKYLRVDGDPGPDLWDPVSGFYPTGDGRWVQLHCNFPHHRDGVLRVLGVGADREAIAEAIARWEAAALEDALDEAGMCAAMVRTREEWTAHPQAAAVASLPLLEVSRIGDSPPEPLAAGARPLAGIRVLDLTRVLAGPTCGRALAEHGADVMRIGAAHLPSRRRLVMDTGHGKLAADLDLHQPTQRERLLALVREADVFSQSYRPGALAAWGLGAEALAALRPGIVYVTLSAYGHQGPWRGRRGFDTLVQCATGIAAEQGGDGPPAHLPGSVLDYVTGYLSAFGTMVALARRTREGGSYLVRLSLCQTARWLDGLGRLAGEDARRRPDQSFDDVADLTITSSTPFGRLTHLAPAVSLSETPAHWARPAVPLGHHRPAWPPRVAGSG